MSTTQAAKYILKGVENWNKEFDLHTEAFEILLYSILETVKLTGTQTETEKRKKETTEARKKRKKRVT